MSGSVAELHQRAELLAANLPPLLIRADRVAATVSQGVHGRRRVGQGETFWQYRRYEAGDPIQKIDWRRSAKSDPVYIRENEWEAAQSVWLWSDGSPSMRYASNRRLPQKVDHADLLMLATASLLVRAGEHVAPLGWGITPTAGRTALLLLAQALEDRAVTANDNHPDSLPRFEPLPRHGSIVMFGDFLEPLEDIHKAIGRYVDRGITGHMLQILDPAERELPFGGRTRFEGMENEGTALIGRVEGIREQYRDRLGRHRDGLEAIARTAGWTFATHYTNQPVETALLGLFMTLTAPRGTQETY